MRVKWRLGDKRLIIFIHVRGPREELQILEGPGLDGTGSDLLPPVWFIAECAIFSGDARRMHISVDVLWCLSKGAISRLWCGGSVKCVWFRRKGRTGL